MREPRLTVDDVRPLATITVSEAAQLLGISRNNAYAAAKDGSLLVVRLGNRLLVPTAPLLAMLGQEAA